MEKHKIVIKFNSPVILWFLAACVVALVLNILTVGKTNELLFVTYHSPLTDPLTYVRFFTHIFGHSGWSHLIGNASYLLLLGPVLEEKYGQRNLIIVMAITAFITALINYIFFPHVALCGASGVVFAFILLISFTSVRSGEIPVTTILVAIVFLGQQIYDGIFVEDNISNMAHTVGGVVGGVSGFIFNGRGKKR